MSGLVGYDNSDEEEGVGVAEFFRQETSTDLNPTESISSNIKAQVSNGHAGLVLNATELNAVKDRSSPNGDIIGPSAQPTAILGNSGIDSAPQSPYSANRAIIHDLTLPLIPNLDIPPSPPGSPPPGIDEKFNQFLKFKKQGVHFNEKLARSSALKNPSLLKKLMDFAGVEEYEQYATTLPKELWDPAGFPPWAYIEELAKSQQDVTKRKEEERLRTQRESIDFVPAAASSSASQAGTPFTSVGPKGSKGSAAERVMAGLDRKRKSPQVSNLATRSCLDRKTLRSGDDIGKQSGRSRSPGRRKRSRSR